MMNKIIAMVALTLLVASNAWAAPGSVSGHRDGRFQLFHAKNYIVVTDSAGKDSRIEEDSVLRIDTETGKTWIYVDRITGGVRSHAWYPVDEMTKW